MIRRLLAILTVALFPLSACGGEPCQSEILDEQTSPDGAYVAAIMIRTCDDGSPLTIDGRQVTLVKAVLMRAAEAEGYGDDPLAGALHIVDGDWPLAIRWIDAGWFAISSGNPPDRLIRWSPNYPGGVVVYE